MSAAGDRNNFDNKVDSYLGFLKNEYVTAGVSLFLILYAGVIAPKLPANVLKWFENWIVQVALFFAIVYISNKNATVALIAAVAVLVTLMIANNQITLRMATEAVAAERFSVQDGNNGYMLEPTDQSVFQYQNDSNNISYMDDIDGVMDEDIEVHDFVMAGMCHAVAELPMAVVSSSNNVASMRAPEYTPGHTPEHTLEIMPDIMPENLEEIINKASEISGINEEQDAESDGSSLMDGSIMGEEYANA
jgi:hypothetical protein